MSDYLTTVPQAVVWYAAILFALSAWLLSKK